MLRTNTEVANESRQRLLDSDSACDRIEVVSAEERLFVHGPLAPLFSWVRDNLDTSRKILSGIGILGIIMCAASRGSGGWIFFGIVFIIFAAVARYYLDIESVKWLKHKRESEDRARYEAEANLRAKQLKEDSEKQRLFLEGMMSRYPMLDLIQIVTVHGDKWTCIDSSTSDTIFTLSCINGPLSGCIFNFKKKGTQFELGPVPGNNCGLSVKFNQNCSEATFLGAPLSNIGQAVYVPAKDSWSVTCESKSILSEPSSALSVGGESLPPVLVLFVTRARWLSARRREMIAQQDYQIGFSDVQSLRREAEEAAKRPFEQWREQLKAGALSSCHGCSTSGANIYVCKKCSHSYCTNCKEGSVNVCPACNSYDGITASSIWMEEPPHGHYSHAHKRQIESDYASRLEQMEQLLDARLRPILDREIADIRSQPV